MEIITLILGYILGMMQLINSMRIILSCLSSYVVIKIAYPAIYIWNFREYNDIENYYLFWNFEHKYLCIGLVLFFLGIFYWILPRLFAKIISGRIEKKINNKYSSISNRKIFNLKGYVRKGLRKYYSAISFFYTPDEKLDIQTAPSYNKFLKIYAQTFSMSIHVFIVVSFLFNNYLIPKFIFFIIILFFSIILFLLPIYLVARTQITNIIAEEHNRIVV